MQYTIILMALFSAFVWASNAQLVERQTIVPIVTVQTITVTPSTPGTANAVSVLASALSSKPANLTEASTTSESKTTALGSVVPMSGPGASSNGQTNAGEGAGAKTYLTTDAIGETFIVVVPTNVHTVYATTPTEKVATTVKTTTSASSKSNAPPPPSSSSSSQLAAATAFPAALLGLAGVAGIMGVM